MRSIVVIFGYIFFRFMLGFTGEIDGAYLQGVNSFYSILDSGFALYTIALTSWWMYEDSKEEHLNTKSFFLKHFFAVVFNVFSAALIFTSKGNLETALEFSGFLPFLGDCIDRHYSIEQMFCRNKSH